MHAGSLTNDTAAARVYKALRRRLGQWVDAWELTLVARTTALSTRVSEVRHQLPKGERIEVKREGGRYFYRLVQEEPVEVTV